MAGTARKNGRTGGWLSHFIAKLLKPWEREGPLSPDSGPLLCVRAVFFVAYFSTRTPLNFLAAFLALPGFLPAMNSPDDLSRLVQPEAPPTDALDRARPQKAAN